MVRFSHCDFYLTFPFYIILSITIFFTIYLSLHIAIIINQYYSDRADELREDNIFPNSIATPFSSLDISLSSIGLSLGSINADQYSIRDDGENYNHDGNKRISTVHDRHSRRQENRDIDDGGGVQAPPSAVLANYFLRTHGGAHGAQCLASLCSVFFGVGAFILMRDTVAPDRQTVLRLVCLRRCLLFALAKHASGLLAAARLIALDIRRIGLRNVKDQRIVPLARDPVARYGFYCSILLIWLDGFGVGGRNNEAWWMTGRGSGNIVGIKGRLSSASEWLVASIIGPVLLREILSTLWMVGDVAVLLASSSSSSSLLSHSDGSDSKLARTFASIITSVSNALGCLLFQPKRWKEADLVTRQVMVAKVVDRLSFVFEGTVCLLLTIDALYVFLEFAMAPDVTMRPKVLGVMRRIICARLYFRFMWNTSHSRIEERFNAVQPNSTSTKQSEGKSNGNGGLGRNIGKVVEGVLDVLLDPLSAMGMGK